MPETPAPLPYKQRMSLTQDALTGLPEHTNATARFQGQVGYWVQGEAVFIPCSNPGTAITFYRQRFNAGEIACSHNLATAAVGRMKAAAALDQLRQQVAAELRGLLTTFRPEGAPGPALALCGIMQDALLKTAQNLGLDLTV